MVRMPSRVWHFSLIEIIVALLGVSIAVGLIFRQHHDQTSQIGEQHQMALDVAYRATLESYRLEVATRYALQLQSPEVLDIMDAALGMANDDLPPLRNRLYRLLKPVYDDLKRDGLTQFQFHLADDRVLLRFQTPNLAGDPLFAMRPMLRQANERRHAINGFEVGRYTPSFRHIFPLGRDGKHFGVVEIGLPFERIQENLAKLLPASDFSLLVRRSVIEANIDTEQVEKFAVSPIDDDFMIENPTISRIDERPAESDAIHILGPLLRRNISTHQRMEEGKSFAIPLIADGKGYVVTFLPLSGNDNSNVSYVVRFTPSDKIVTARTALWMQGIMAGLLVLGLAFAIHYLRLQHQVLQEDIARRKLVEAELEAYQHHLEQLVEERTAALTQANRDLTQTQFAMDGVGIGITWANVETGRFEYANRYMAEFLGYTVDEMLGLGVADIDPSFPMDRFQATVASIRQRGHIKFETTQQRKDGTLVPVEMTIYYHAGSGSLSPVLIAFMVDIVERKRHEAMLVEAKQAAETANIAKSAFLANMSHEIRTPLNAITGMAYILRRSGLTAEQTDKLEKIENAGSHLLHIINDVLDLSKIEAGKLTLEDAPVHVEALLGNVASMLGQKARDKGLRFNVESTSLPCKLCGDATRLQQALLNYVANAIKFTERGHITLRVTQDAETDDTATLRFEVEDTGIGISPEALPRLFNVFEQADNSTTRQHGGTGLGLAITKKIAEVMGGTAGVTSIEGQGSTFWFTAVLKQTGETAAQATRVNGEAAEQAIQRNHAGKRILVAEDEPINREIAQMLLEDVGLKVDLAEEGQQAVEKARSGDYALILMDMQMPRLDGLDATRQIRQLPGHQTTPIVAMTANAFAENKEQCLDAGMDDFLTKPAKPRMLYATVLKWLERRLI